MRKALFIVDPGKELRVDTLVVRVRFAADYRLQMHM